MPSGGNALHPTDGCLLWGPFVSGRRAQAYGFYQHWRRQEKTLPSLIRLGSISPDEVEWRILPRRTETEGQTTQSTKAKWKTQVSKRGEAEYMNSASLNTGLILGHMCSLTYHNQMSPSRVFRSNFGNTTGQSYSLFTFILSLSCVNRTWAARELILKIRKR